ncbi:GntR family transcriptional regulator [Xiamenia xianingshaonis]|uniref:GntR family transcriptional regulator n=1 Tax=Xiamenia xianingshaonis TaxID=2682776 RepID=A0A9E6MP43_9ACTN|nr:GntR family transcriptional regulator [Xiamenia xianingshaonis]NHM14709.1 GntR family transcriptional regulator [Xiamenia xianingshaonis]QTU83759.1 GntR family transcriptional regulator [Xiamenia xianingshaonis]
MGQKEKKITFEADEDSTLPLWVQLRKRIAYLISSGFFKPGDQLPKIRELAADLSINFNTVNKAYLSLQTDGLVKSVRGKGAFVTDLAALQNNEPSNEAEALMDECLCTCRNLGLSYDETVSRMHVRAARLKMKEAAPARRPDSNVIVLFPEDDGRTAGKGA